jgi:hypothetical protein
MWAGRVPSLMLFQCELSESALLRAFPFPFTRTEDRVMSKTLAVIVSGAPERDRLREVTIGPGTRAIDMLNELGLQDYMLSRDGSAEFFADQEEVYGVLEDGAKVRATSRATVGVASFWETVWAALVGLFAEEAAVPAVEKVLVRSRPVRQSNLGTHIRADTRPLWQLRGWQRAAPGRLVGAFRVPKLGSYAGEIIVTHGSPDFFLISPPNSLLQGAHGSCFRPREPGRYWVHFSQSSSDIDSGLVAVEGLLAAALKSGR